MPADGINVQDPGQWQQRNYFIGRNQEAVWRPYRGWCGEQDDKGGGSGWRWGGVFFGI